MCSNFKDDLICKLNLVLNSFSVSAIYVSWLFEIVFVSVALFTKHLVRHLPSSGQEFFADSYIVCHLELIILFGAAAVIYIHIYIYIYIYIYMYLYIIYIYILHCKKHIVAIHYRYVCNFMHTHSQ